MTTRQYTGWRTSSRSDGDGNCVEFTQADDGTIGVRDSKDPNGPVLEFGPDAWRRLLTHPEQEPLTGEIFAVELATRGGETVLEPGRAVTLSWRPQDVFVYGAPT